MNTEDMIDILKDHWKFRLAASPDPIARVHVTLAEWDPKKRRMDLEHHSFVADTIAEAVMNAYQFHIDKIGIIGV